jgi:hypothetical protein
VLFFVLFFLFFELFYRRATYLTTINVISNKKSALFDELTPTRLYVSFGGSMCI